MIANHGQSKRYYHDVVGCNSRLDSMQAAVLNVKLKHLDTYCNARRLVADQYNQAFANHAQITTPTEAHFTKHVYHQYTLKINGVDRDALVAELAANNVSSMIYYPVPAHKQKMFSSLNLPDRNLPITDELTPRVISLPIHTEMKEETQEYIIEQVLKAIKKLS
jgi:dTDP-4-amino-4,6-dideoxygalactose transaminase